MATGDHGARGPGAISLKRRTDGLWVTVSVSGQLDAVTVPALRGALHPEALPGGRTLVMLDASGLEFCDSSGLGVLVAARRKLRDRGGQLILLHVPEFLAHQMKATGLASFIPSDVYLDSS